MQLPLIWMFSCFFCVHEYVWLFAHMCGCLHPSQRPRSGRLWSRLCLVYHYRDKRPAVGGLLRASLFLEVPGPFQLNCGLPKMPDGYSCLLFKLCLRAIFVKLVSNPMEGQRFCVCQTAHPKITKKNKQKKNIILFYCFIIIYFING